jgi:hypothetical protein
VRWRHGEPRGWHREPRTWRRDPERNREPRRIAQTPRGSPLARSPARSSTTRPHRWESRGRFGRHRRETRGQPCWSRLRRPVELVLPEGTTGGQGRRRQPQVRPDSAAEITSTPSRGQPERRRLPQCRSSDRRTPRLHQGGDPGARSAIASRAVPPGGPSFGGFVAVGGQPARARRLGRPGRRDRHPGVGTLFGRRSFNGRIAPSRIPADPYAGR